MPWDKDDDGKGPKSPWENNDKKNGGKDPFPGQREDRPQKPADNPWARRTGPSAGNGNPIDDLIDNIQARVKKMMSGGGSSGGTPHGGSKGGSSGGSGASWGLGIIIVLGVVVLWLGSGLYRVQPDEVGVVMRFGRMERISISGLQYHLPSPIETVIVQKVTTLNIIDGGMKTEKNGDSSESNLILTGDENMIHTNYTVQWKIKDVSEYLFTVENQESTIRAAAASVVREVIGQTTARLALAEGRGQIEIHAQEILQKLLDQYKMGIQIVSIQLQGVAPPNQVVDAYNDMQAAQLNAGQYENEGRAYESEKIPQAKGQAAQINNEATAYSQRVVAEAGGEASRFEQVRAAYESYPRVTLQRYHLETMQTVLSKASKIIVDDKAGKSILPLLNLTEMKGKIIDHPTEHTPSKQGATK